LGLFWLAENKEIRFNSFWAEKSMFKKWAIKHGFSRVFLAEKGGALTSVCSYKSWVLTTVQVVLGA